MGRVKTVAFTHTANLIRYNSCDRGVRHACDKDYGERKMAKTTPKAKNSAFMKPMEPSEHLAKIVGTEPLPRSEVTKKFGPTLRSTNFKIQRTNEKSWPTISCSRSLAVRNWTCFR